MSKTLQYGFWLILILIVLTRYAGATEVGSVLFSGINKIVNTLQGRKSDGSFADYPKQ